MVLRLCLERWRLGPAPRRSSGRPGADHEHDSNPGKLPADTRQHAHRLREVVSRTRRHSCFTSLCPQLRLALKWRRTQLLVASSTPHPEMKIGNLSKWLFLLAALITGFGWVPIGQATAQTFTTLYNFTWDSTSLDRKST